METTQVNQGPDLLLRRAHVTDNPCICGIVAYMDGWFSDVLSIFKDQCGSIFHSHGLSGDVACY